MATDVFGDLREWGDVLDRLARLRAARELDDHQDGLVRLLRNQDNWRLREEALLSATQVMVPSRSLVDATLKVLGDPEESLENRVLAARALGWLLVACQARPDGHLDIEEPMATMQCLMSNGGPPVLHAAMRAAFNLVTGPDR